MERLKFKTTDEYISAFPGVTQQYLKKMRSIVRKACPDAQEVISYNMPALYLEGVLIYYAGYKKHIGFYPTGSGIEHFKSILTDYKWSKGAIQFPLDKSLPVQLITDIVKFRLKENNEKAQAKLKKIK